MGFDPVSLGLQAGGAVLNFVQQQEIAKATQAALARARASRLRYDAANNAVFQDSLAAFQPAAVAAEMRGQEGARRDAYTQAIPNLRPEVFVPGNAGPIVGNAVTRNLANASNRGVSDAAGRAVLDSLKDFNFASGARATRAGEKINQNNNFSAAEQALTGLDLEAAQSKGQNPIGDLLMGFGQIVGNARANAGMKAKPLTYGTQSTGYLKSSPFIF